MKKERVTINGKVVGNWLPIEKQMVLPRRRSKHFFRTLNAWGINTSLLSTLISKGCKAIIINEKEEDETFVAYPGTFMKLGVTKDMGEHGVQTFLSQNHFMSWETYTAQQDLFEVEP